MQHGTEQVGNVFPSWKDFGFSLRKQFYPLGYKEKDLIEWKNPKLRKGQIMQEYTDEFCKMALMLNISLHTEETLMKYIGGYLHIFITLYLCLDLLILMRFMSKQRILKQRKQELVYQGNRLQGKKTNERGMERKKVQRS